MALDIDILIVFADADNEPSGNSEVGWVSQFKKFPGIHAQSGVDSKNQKFYSRENMTP